MYVSRINIYVAVLLLYRELQNLAVPWTLGGSWSAPPESAPHAFGL